MELTDCWHVIRSVIIICPPWGIYVTTLKDISYRLNIVIFASLVLFCFLAPTFIFFYILSWKVSFVHSLTGDSDLRLIHCQDLKNTTWADDESIVSFEDKSDQQNVARIESENIPLFAGDDCTNTHTHTHIYIMNIIQKVLDLTQKEEHNWTFFEATRKNWIIY